MNDEHPTTERPVHELLAQIEDTFHTRLEALEDENRRIRRNGRLLGIGLAATLGVLVIVLLAAGRVLATGAGTGDVVQARQFLLQDAAGQTRGVWSVEDDGATRLILRDRAGVPRLRLSVLEGGAPGAAFTDADNQPRLVLGVLPDETTNLVVADRAGNTRAVLGLSRDDAASLVLADPFGVTRAALGVDYAGAANLTLVEDAGNDAPPAVP